MMRRPVVAAFVVWLASACVSEPTLWTPTGDLGGSSGDTGDSGQQDGRVCSPDCEGKECGGDGCEGSCGACSEHHICEEGGCTYVPWCGDGSCDVDEGCEGCSEDCGECPKPCAPTCGVHEECVEASSGGWFCTPQAIEVAASEFWMGCNQNLEESCEPADLPYHLVKLDSYSIDKTEITGDQYWACVTTGGCTVASEGNYCSWQQPGMEDSPINCVTWPQANDYCSWVGRRLCTEAEWEKAARGDCEHNGGGATCEGQSRKYPWGTTATATCEFAVWKSVEGVGCGTNDLFPVCSKSPAGDSPYGLCDMAGNVGEWVADWYGSNYYCMGAGAATSKDGGWAYCPPDSNWPGGPSAWMNPKGPEPENGEYRVWRGGGFAHPDIYQHVSYRGSRIPESQEPSIGFRCCGAAKQ